MFAITTVKSLVVPRVGGRGLKFGAYENKDDHHIVVPRVGGRGLKYYVYKTPALGLWSSPA